MKKLLIILSVVLILATAGFGQKRRPAKSAPAPKPKSVIFAVVNDGVAVEPIAYLEGGKLSPPALGDSDAKVLAAFNKSYYAPKTAYGLVFGGKNGGSVTITKASEASDCAKNMAEISVAANKAKIKGFIMALATNGPLKAGPGVRRMPTYAERADVESLVRAEMGAHKVSSDALKNLHYHNLTALDVDGDGKPELVGSYWTETSPKERARLFFIADKGADGKFSFGYSEFELTKESDVMNSEIKALDEGIYNELLLDAYDTDGDGVAEIFTVVKGFEANSFNVYKREGGKWVRKYDVSNYHCAY